jgi:alkanesulfonate monooxygenase SsuD/methylene tetrahydromethanopterin reductase-like flavin-dependent oxidoreductase (luciferase family)
MKLGFFLPQIGPAARAETIVSLAKRAEEIGYDSLWVTDRLLYPVQPQSPYLGTPDGSLPEVYKNVFDPILALTFAAAHTS